MPKLSDTSVPTYRRHKATGQAVVSIEGRDFYLGKCGTAASRSEYNRRIAEWLAAGRKLPVDPQLITVGEVAVAFKKHSETYYRNPDGTPSKEADRVKRELTPLDTACPELACGELVELSRGRGDAHACGEQRRTG